MPRQVVVIAHAHIPFDMIPDQHKNPLHPHPSPKGGFGTHHAEHKPFFLLQSPSNFPSLFA